MEYLINKSLILTVIFKAFVFLYNKFKESAIYNLSGRFFNKIAYYFSYSKIWIYLKGEDFFDKIWSNSLIYNICNTIINWPSALLRTFYLKHEKIFLHSYGFKFIHWLAEDFHSLLGLSLILTFMIPDHRWYNIYGVLFTLGLFVLFFIRTIVKPHNHIDIKNIDFTLILFMLVIGLSTFTSLFIADSINYFIYYLISLITVIMIVSSTNNEEDLSKIIELMIIGTFLTAIYGIYQWKVVGIAVNPSLTDVTVNQGMSGRVFSTLGNPNIYGEYLVLTLPFFGTVIINSKSWWKKGIYTIMLLPIILILLKTGSRSAWVSFAFSVFVFVFYTNKKLLPFMILAGVFAIPLLPQSIYRRLLTIFNPNDSSVQYRKKILEPAIPMLKDYWLTGVGLGNQVFNTIYKRYKSFTLKTVAHTHNLYLQIWLEAGIFAIGTFILLIFRLVKKSSNIISTKKKHPLSYVLVACLSSIAGILVMGFADHVWFYNRILFLFFIIVGLAFTAIKIANEEE